ncbi:sterol desaturase family protein [Amylibacter sp. SFDW26]|uniref:sterol desaturase family protein n=1 Tax=Amylibacter sp. SFDW26 TaxID=2652722 RepID=UPI001D0198CA|nr:sterol desaturase family protein [Amylibacter sp. SFDW26]
MMEFFEQITSIFVDFTDPRKRIFVGYLALSLLIAFLWLILFKRTTFSTAIAKVFDRKVFFSASSKADYKIFVINRLFSLFISPLLLTQIAIATAIYLFLHRQDFIQSGYFNDVNIGVVVASFTLFVFVIDDFTKYLVHRWMHRFHVLWAIHKVHHSAETLTPVTVYRVHPLEGILYGLRSAFAQGVAISTFLFLFGNSVDLYTIVGVNILSFVFHVTGSNLRHSHISISYWPWLEYILISPAQHQLHHSIAEEHYDKNFGVALAIWDWMFGSLHLSEDDKELEFGLLPNEASATNMIDIYTRPFLDISKIISRRARNFKQATLRIFSN